MDKAQQWVFIDFIKDNKYFTTINRTDNRYHRYGGACITCLDSLYAYTVTVEIN